MLNGKLCDPDDNVKRIGIGKHEDDKKRYSLRICTYVRLDDRWHRATFLSTYRDVSLRELLVCDFFGGLLSAVCGILCLHVSVGYSY